MMLYRCTLLWGLYKSVQESGRFRRAQTADWEMYFDSGGFWNSAWAEGSSVSSTGFDIREFTKYK